MERRGDDLEVLFDGYENEGAYPVPASDVTLLPTDTPQHQEHNQQVSLHPSRHVALESSAPATCLHSCALSTHSICVCIHIHAYV